MQFIRDTLGYSDDLFADYDASAGALTTAGIKQES
jgi:hypothetical protein